MFGRKPESKQEDWTVSCNHGMGNGLLEPVYRDHGTGQEFISYKYFNKVVTSLHRQRNKSEFEKSLLIAPNDSQLVISKLVTMEEKLHQFTSEVVDLRLRVNRIERPDLFR